MLRFAANLTMLFTELPFLERFEAAKQAGFDAVEYLFPYAYSVEQLQDLLQKYSLVQVLHNLPAGNWEAGERGIACDPDRTEEFREGVGRAVRYASALNCSRLNCLAGKLPSGCNRETAIKTLTSNLAFAAKELRAVGIQLLIEPINTFDIPGFAVSKTQDALDLIAAVGSDNVFLQYDIYHAQRMEGELAETIRKHLPIIRHIQLADNPGRHEPGSGEINYGWLLSYLDSLGWDGYIGCEYKPATSTTAGLGWLRSFK